jgi:hypothetical protein
MDVSSVPQAKSPHRDRALAARVLEEERIRVEIMRWWWR